GGESHCAAAVAGVACPHVPANRRSHMHAVVVKVSVEDGSVATGFLRETIVPRVAQAPGFVAGYWVRLEGGDEGNSTIVFESEEAARQASAQIRGNVEQNPGLTVHSVTVGEVVANA